MLRHMGSRLTGLVLAAAFAGAFLAPAAQATTIGFYNDAATQQTLRFTIGCGSADGDCTNVVQALYGEGPVWNASIGQMLAGPSNASPASETGYVNGLLGTNLTANTGGNVTPNGLSFDTDAQYILLKVGNGQGGLAYALLENLSSTVDLYFTKNGKAAGLSHYITFGTASGGGTPPTPVPEPGILGMFGFGLLTIGFGYALKRRRMA